jgi:anti-sigma factor ChrR (cupin superfamily)
MSAASDKTRCGHSELVALHALGALTPEETGLIEAHIPVCADCQHELDALRPVLDTFVHWPTDILRPSDSLLVRLTQRIAAETRKDPVLPSTRDGSVLEWDEVAPGISCKLLANDTDQARVSMLVRLSPGAAYPAHTHAGIEELHLLDGELWIDDKKLYPGDYNRAEPGTSDRRVWSETGCTCLLTTSLADVLG